MNPRLPAHYFDGRHLAPHAVEAELEAGLLRVHGLAAALECPLDRLRISDRLALIPRFIRLPGGDSLEIPDNDAVDAWLRTHGRGRTNAVIHWLEQRSRIAAAATLLLVLTVAATVHYGLPALSHHLAHAVPAELERDIGRLALRSLDAYFPRSQTTAKRRAEIERDLASLLRARGITQDAQLEFRMGGAPNALALPGGVIVVTDELVQLASPEELAAVLAHEVAHWQLRHGLQSLFRGSGSLVLVSVVTGDLSTLTTFAAAIPLVILQRGYSRDFETEADDHAAETLRLAGRDPRHLAAILAKIEPPGPQRVASYFSTHPGTAERITRIDPTGTYRELQPSAPAKVTDAMPSITPPPTGRVRTSDASADVQPRHTHAVAPVYPPLRRLLNQEGTVTLEYIVDAEGRVAATQVLEATHAEFAEAVVEAVRQWRFEPGLKDGRPVNTRVVQQFPFTLGEAAPEGP